MGRARGYDQTPKGQKKKVNTKRLPKWDDLVELRNQVIEAIRVPHEKTAEIGESFKPVIESDKELLEVFKGIEKSYEDMLEQIKVITSSHSKVVVNEETKEENTVFETGMLNQDEIEEGMKYNKILNEYHGVLMTAYYSGTEGITHLVNKIEEIVNKLDGKEVTPPVNEEEVNSFKETYNGETLKEDFMNSLSEASKKKEDLEEVAKEDVEKLTKSFQHTIDNLTSEEVDKGSVSVTKEEEK